MLTVTDAAGSYVADLLTEADAPEGVAIRFVMEEQGIALRIDEKQDGDSVFDHEGRTIMVLDEQMTDFLAERTLDVEDSDEGPKLSLR